MRNLDRAALLLASVTLLIANACSYNPPDGKCDDFDAKPGSYNSPATCDADGGITQQVASCDAIQGITYTTTTTPCGPGQRCGTPDGGWEDAPVQCLPQ